MSEEVIFRNHRDPTTVPRGRNQISNSRKHSKARISCRRCPSPGDNAGLGGGPGQRPLDCHAPRAVRDAGGALRGRLGRAAQVPPARHEPLGPGACARERRARAAARRRRLEARGPRRAQARLPGRPAGRRHCGPRRRRPVLRRPALQGRRRDEAAENEIYGCSLTIDDYRAMIIIFLLIIVIFRCC